MKDDDVVGCIYSDDVCIFFIWHWIDSQVFLRCTPTNEASILQHLPSHTCFGTGHFRIKNIIWIV